MKSPCLALAFALAVALPNGVNAQATGDTKPAAKQHLSAHEMSPWKEMNAFHTVLAAVYHPAAEAGNVKPLRQKANDLAAKAREWATSTAPAACATESNRATVAAISLDAVAIGNQVLAEASDADLKKAITALHGKFEGVEKTCSAGGMKHDAP
jgi:hypothetical protein